MRSSRPGKRAVILTAVSVLLFFPLVAGAYVKLEPVPELARQSGSVVQGSVVAMEYRMDPADGLIYTYVTLEVRQDLLGQGTAPRVVVKVPGGEIGGLGLKVSDTPYFDMGEEVIAFLDPEPSGTYRVHGWFQGKMDVKNGKVTDFDLPIPDFVDWLTGRSPRAVKGEPAKAKPSGNGRGKVCYKLCGYSWVWVGKDGNGNYHPQAQDPANPYWEINPSNTEGLSPAQVYAAIQAAANEWTNSPACFSFYTGAAGSTLTGPRLDSHNVVSFGSTNGSVATTYYWYISGTGRMIEVDLVFNQVNWNWGVNVCGSTSLFDLQNVATHEFGHWLCLGDQYTKNDADHTMYGYVDYGWCYQRTLHQCDIDGIVKIYGSCGF